MICNFQVLKKQNIYMKILYKLIENKLWLKYNLIQKT